MSPRAATRTLPAIQPIIPELQATPFDHPDWLFEPKYDGFRGILHLTPTGAGFTSETPRAVGSPAYNTLLKFFGS